MSKDNTWILTVIFGLCLWTTPLNATTQLSQQDTYIHKAFSGESSPQEVLKHPKNIPIKDQKITKSSLKSTSTCESNSSGLIIIPLSLFHDSVDDMYYGCSDEMLIKVKRHYLPRSTREGLHTLRTERCAFKVMRKKDIYDQLSLNHFKALCAYTAGSYNNLNPAIRKGKASYKTNFEFHALHFLLSDAIRLLKLNQRSCYTTFRRTNLLFSGKPGQTIRFGSFASSSLNKNLQQFGRRTCFEIRTCFGAYLKSYSEFDSDEDEVLIPPFEMFKIVSVDFSGENLLGCDVFYKLDTAGIYSSLNCQAVDSRGPLNNKK